MNVRELIADHGSPLWLADADLFSANLRAFESVWKGQWPQSRIAYSYKTNRLAWFLHRVERAGGSAEVVCLAEYELARRVVADPTRIVVDGPAKPEPLLTRAGADGALVIADSLAELERAAAAGVRRVGLRVAVNSFTGTPSRFGIPPAEILAAARAAAALGLSVRALSVHLVSTDFEATSGRVVVSWPRAPDEHAAAAALLARLASQLGLESHAIDEIDLGGGLPAASACAGHARAVTRALRDHGFSGGLLLEPGRAVAADAVDLALSVVAIKSLACGARCVICDAGTNFLPGALTGPPRLDVPGRRGPRSPALVTGPLCLNADVVHPCAQLPALEPGDLLLARAVGAYQQSASTEFGEARPRVLVSERGTWRPADDLHHRRQVERQAA
ncbi:MAG: hypothetical protein JO179_02150 [Solirubrobacterales bacterium]|nr:hypothetical protein [Solirubrobacterales bacterium]